jgi:hypothetical protein
MPWSSPGSNRRASSRRTRRAPSATCPEGDIKCSLDLFMCSCPSMGRHDHSTLRAVVKKNSSNDLEKDVDSVCYILKSRQIFARRLLVSRECDTQMTESLFVMNDLRGCYPLVSVGASIPAAMRPATGQNKTRTPSQLLARGLRRSQDAVETTSTPSRAWQADPPDPGRAGRHGRPYG